MNSPTNLKAKDGREVPTRRAKWKKRGSIQPKRGARTTGGGWRMLPQSIGAQTDKQY